LRTKPRQAAPSSSDARPPPTPLVIFADPEVTYNLIKNLSHRPTL